MLLPQFRCRSVNFLFAWLLFLVVIKTIGGDGDGTSVLESLGVFFFILDEPFVDEPDGSILENHLAENGVHPSLIFRSSRHMRDAGPGGESVSHPLALLRSRLPDGDGEEGEDKFLWVCFLTATTQVNPERLVAFIRSKEDSRDPGTSPLFFGVGLQDPSLSIYHHFFRAPGFFYPFLPSGFILSRGLADSLLDSMEIELPRRAIDIDTIHDSAKEIWTRLKVSVRSDTAFCWQEPEGRFFTQRPPEGDSLEAPPPDQIERDQARAQCAFISAPPLPSSGRGPRLQPKHVAILVKTGRAMHESRLPRLKALWADPEGLPEGLAIRFMSDQADDQIPTVGLPVEPVDSGHCEKMRGLIRYAEKAADLRDRLFYVIVDDDTLVSVRRLIALLDKFVEEGPGGALRVIPMAAPVYMGRRYSYGHAAGPGGYDYVTTGGGLVVDRRGLALLGSECRECRCSGPADYDDMALGRWSTRQRMRPLNLESFHQTPPGNYHPVHLRTGTHVTFHKFDSKEPENDDRTMEGLLRPAPPFTSTQLVLRFNGQSNQNEKPPHSSEKDEL